MNLDKMKTAKVLSSAGGNLVKDVDNSIAKTLMALEDTKNNMQGELTVGLLGLAMNVGITMLPSEIMTQAVDGIFEVTDIIEAADVAGDALIGGAALSLANKFVANYKSLGIIDDMTDDEFNELLSSRTSGNKKVIKKTNNVIEFKDVEDLSGIADIV